MNVGLLNNIKTIDIKIILSFFLFFYSKDFVKIKSLFVWTSLK